MMSQVNRNAALGTRPVRRPASAAQNRRLRLEPLERRCPLDAAGFGNLMGPVDFTSIYVAPVAGAPPSIASVVSEATPIPIEPLGPDYPPSFAELPNRQDDLGSVGDGDSIGEPQEETPRSEGKSTDAPLTGSETDSTDSGDASLPGNGEAVDPLIGEKDGNKDDLGGLVTAIKLVSFAPLRGPSGSISLDQDNSLNREDSATGSVTANRNRAVSNADLAIEVDAEASPKARSEVSLTKTRYFKNESSGSLQENSLNGIRRQAASLRMFARQSTPDEEGISIGALAADQHRRRFASWKNKSSVHPSETRDDAMPPNDATVATDGVNTDLAIIEWVNISLGNAKTITSLSPTLTATGSISTGLIGSEGVQPEIAIRDAKEKTSDEDKAIALSDVTRNPGPFAVLGMLVSHGISAKVRRRFRYHPVDRCATNTTFD